ncbi:MAG: hypothetical protein U1E65_17000 [Myxococcota bacterium]
MLCGALALILLGSPFVKGSTELAVEVRGALPGGTSGAAFAAIKAAVDARTDFETLEIQTFGVASQELDACPSDRLFACWAHAFRRNRPAYLFVVRLEPSEAGAAVTAIWLPIVGASQSGAEPTEEERFEQSASMVGKVTSADALREEVMRLLDEQLKPRLEAAGRWDPSGSLLVDADGPVRVQLDGVDLGQGPTQLVLERVRIGIHRLEYVGASGAQTERVEVKLDERARAAWIHDVVAPARTAAPPAAIGRASLIGGSALVLGGVVLSVWAAAAHQPFRGALACAAPPCGEGARFATFADLTGSSGDPRQGLLVAPLGYSLALAGGTAAIGAWILDQSEDSWWTVLAALGLGALSYGVSALAN